MKFYKLAASGNDFIVTETLIDDEKQIPLMCDRHFGIGADGVICLLECDDADIEMRIYNSDGTLARMCGNGLKIVSYYLKNIKRKKGPNYTIKTSSGLKLVGWWQDKYYALVETPHQIGQSGEYILYDAGNKHALKTVAEIDKNQLLFDASLEELKGYNVTHIKIRNPNAVELLTHENGVGITLSCGTASLSSFAYLRSSGSIASHLEIITLGGIFSIDEVEDRLALIGEVDYIYRGVYKNGYK